MTSDEIQPRLQHIYCWIKVLIISIRFGRAGVARIFARVTKGSRWRNGLTRLAGATSDVGRATTGLVATKGELVRKGPMGAEIDTLIRIIYGAR